MKGNESKQYNVREQRVVQFKPSPMLQWEYMPESFDSKEHSISICTGRSTDVQDTLVLYGSLLMAEHSKGVGLACRTHEVWDSIGLTPTLARAYLPLKPDMRDDSHEYLIGDATEGMGGILDMDCDLEFWEKQKIAIHLYTVRCELHRWALMAQDPDMQTSTSWHLTLEAYPLPYFMARHPMCMRYSKRQKCYVTLSNDKIGLENSYSFLCLADELIRDIVNSAQHRGSQASCEETYSCAQCPLVCHGRSVSTDVVGWMNDTTNEEMECTNSYQHWSVDAWTDSQYESRYARSRYAASFAYQLLHLYLEVAKDAARQFGWKVEMVEADPSDSKGIKKLLEVVNNDK